MDRLLDILVKPFNLKFAPEEEAEFRVEQDKDMSINLRYVLAGLLISFLAYYLISDRTDVSTYFLSLCIPAILFGIVMTFFPRNTRHSQLIVSTISAAVQLGIYWFVAKHTENGKADQYNYLVPLILGHFVALRLLFIPSLISALVVFAGVMIITQHFKSSDLSTIFYITCMCYILGMLICQRLEVMRRDNFISLRELERERKKTRVLVERIIPKTLINRIMHVKKDEMLEFCDDVELCSVMFAELSGNVDKLARRQLFRIFDSIVGRSKIEKIKTAENSYIAAGGLFGTKPNAEELLNIAIRFRQEIIQYNIDQNKNVMLRVGIASGNASTGVIGQRVFAFDIWGKPVNLASRIKNITPWGSICLSKSALTLLPDGYLFQSLGDFQLKGVGAAEVYEFQVLQFDKRFMDEVAA